MPSSWCFSSFFCRLHISWISNRSIFKNATLKLKCQSSLKLLWISLLKNFNIMCHKSHIWKMKQNLPKSFWKQKQKSTNWCFEVTWKSAPKPQTIVEKHSCFPMDFANYPLDLDFNKVKTRYVIFLLLIFGFFASYSYYPINSVFYS